MLAGQRIPTSMKGGLVRLLDYFSAFCSIDMAGLHLVLEKLGMHPDDVDVEWGAFDEAVT